MSFLTGLTRNEKIITLLTAITVFFHFLGATGNSGKSIDFFGFAVLDLGLLFIVNAIGFIILLIGGYFLDLDYNLDAFIPYSQYYDDLFDYPFDLTNVLRLLLPLWTVGTLIGWLLYHHVSVGGTFLDPQVYLDPSLITKLVEVLIVIFWFFDFQEIRRETRMHKARENQSNLTE
ncbi:MAG: hypothetical protein ACW981_19440 [Candidatus Hodarchaeales archaeon]|jgi:hypothetical protein